MALLTHETLERLIDEVGLDDRRDTILSVVRNSIRVSVTEAFTDDSALRPGTSKFGGLPDLPSGATWPQWNGKALSFVAQINLADVTPHDVDHLLPNRGLLSFFYNGYQWIEGEPFEPGMWQVVYFDGESPSLQRMSVASNFGEYNSEHRSVALAFSSEITLPPWESYYGVSVLGFTYEEGVDEKIEKLCEKAHEIVRSDNDYSKSRLLGHPDQIQGDVFWEAHDARQGKSLRDHSVSPYDDPTSGITDWLLLFQLDSEYKAGMMSGDAGRLYYCIQRADLTARAFYKAICTMQCS